MTHLSHGGLQLQLSAWRSLDSDYGTVQHGPAMAGHSHHQELEVIVVASGPEARAAIRSAEQARREGWLNPAEWMGHGGSIGHSQDSLPPGAYCPQSPSVVHGGLGFSGHPHLSQRRRRIDPIEFCIHYRLTNTTVAPLSFHSIVLEFHRRVGPPFVISNTFGAKEAPESKSLKGRGVHEWVFSTDGHTSDLICHPEYDNLKLRFMAIHRDRIVMGPVTSTLPALAQLPRIDRDVFASAFDTTCPEGAVVLPLSDLSCN